VGIFGRKMPRMKMPFLFKCQEPNPIKQTGRQVVVCLELKDFLARARA